MRKSDRPGRRRRRARVISCLKKAIASVTGFEYNSGRFEDMEREKVLMNGVFAGARTGRAAFFGRKAFRIVSALGLAAILLCSCSGQALPVNGSRDIAAPPGPIDPPTGKGSGMAFIRLNEIGDDIDVTGKIVSPLVHEALKKAGIKLCNTENEAEIIVHGTVTLRHASADRRLGLDHHYYTAQAAWQLIRTGGHRSIFKRETSAKGEGIGKSEAIRRTLTSLSESIAGEALPRLKIEFAGR